MAVLGEIHQPQPLTYSPPSSHPRPGSRSERLLRDTLLRDELERAPLPTTSPTPPPVTAPRDHHTVSSSGKAHRRRHSHVPSTGNSNASSHLRSPSHSQSAALLKHYQYTLSSPSSSTYPEENAANATQYALGSFRFRTAITNPSFNTSPTPSKKRSAAAAGHYDGDHEGHYRDIRNSHPSSRSNSPVPTPPAGHQLGRRHSLRRQSSGNLKHCSSGDECMEITPHGLVLKARLERVLHAGGNEQREIKRRGQGCSMERDDERPLTRSRRQCNEVRDEDSGWPWRDREATSPTMPNTPPGSNYHSSVPSNSPSHSPHHLTRAQSPHVRNRSKTDPVAYLSHITSVSPGQTYTGPQLCFSPSSTTKQHEAQGSILLTPPPTPPSPTRGGLPHSPAGHHRRYASIEFPRDRREEVTRNHRSSMSPARRKSSSPPASHHSHDSIYGTSSRPTFNARKASEVCKSMEGYISFSSIEGLGQPPEDLTSPTDDDDERECRYSERGRGMWTLRGVSLDWRRLLGSSTGKEEISTPRMSAPPLS